MDLKVVLVLRLMVTVKGTGHADVLALLQQVELLPVFAHTVPGGQIAWHHWSSRLHQVYPAEGNCFRLCLCLVGLGHLHVCRTEWLMEPGLAWRGGERESMVG